MIAVAFLSSAIQEDKNLSVGKNAPLIETVEGENVGKITDTDKKMKMISFWNPKNASSRISNRNLSQQYGKNSESNIEFVSICVDSDIPLMNEVLKVDGLETINNYSYSEFSPRVFKDYGAIENPKAYLISSEGKILEII